MPTVLITGANRGIGLELARQYAADGWTVIATVREESPELGELGVEVSRLDVRDFDAVVRFGQAIDTLDLLIANAGTYGPRNPDHRSDDAEAWSETFAVNTIAPFLLAQSVFRQSSAAAASSSRSAPRWARSPTRIRAGSSLIVRPSPL